MRPPLLPTALIALTVTLVGCVTTNAPSSYLKVDAPLVRVKVQDRTPAVAITFVSGVTSEASDSFIDAYTRFPVTPTFETEPGAEPGSGDQRVASREDAVANVSALVAKTSFYAMELHEYLTRHLGDHANVMLNPVKIDRKNGRFVYLERTRPAAYEVEIDFMAYVDPLTSPATVDSLVSTTFGEQIAPIVSITTHPQFHQEAQGAIALTEQFLDSGSQVKGHGLRAGLIEFLNAHSGARSPAQAASLGKLASTERPFRRGRFLTLDMDGQELIEPAAGSEDAQRFANRRFVADELFQIYHNIVADALANLDFSKPEMALKQAYFELFDPHGARALVVGYGQRNAHAHILDQFQNAEVKLHAERDRRFVSNVMDTNEWRANMTTLREAEQGAHKKYRDAQIQAALGALAAFGGAIMAASSDNAFAQTMGVTLAAVGLTYAVQASFELDAIEETFGDNYDPVYSDLAAQSVTTIDGETLVIRARNLADMRVKMRRIYREKVGTFSA